MDEVAVALSAVLSGMMFPARKWQLLAQADYYGADFTTRAHLRRLPEILYPDLATVIATVAPAQHRAPMADDPRTPSS